MSACLFVLHPSPSLDSFMWMLNGREKSIKLWGTSQVRSLGMIFPFLSILTRNDQRKEANYYNIMPPNYHNSSRRILWSIVSKSIRGQKAKEWMYQSHPSVSKRPWQLLTMLSTISWSGIGPDSLLPIRSSVANIQPPFPQPSSQRGRGESSWLSI